MRSEIFAEFCNIGCCCYFNVNIVAGICVTLYVSNFITAFQRSITFIRMCGRCIAVNVDSSEKQFFYLTFRRTFRSDDWLITAGFAFCINMCRCLKRPSHCIGIVLKYNRRCGCIRTFFMFFINIIAVRFNVCIFIYRHKLNDTFSILDIGTFKLVLICIILIFMVCVCRTVYAYSLT